MAELSQIYRSTAGWRRWIIRTRAYFLKEVNEIRRQPLLVLSLIIGPLLVLILFGATFVNSNPRLRTALVLPEGGIAGLSEERIRRLAALNFELNFITTDRNQAEELLTAGQLDVVQILPPDLFAALQSGNELAIEFRSNAINPLLEGWIQYLAYAQVNEINKAILRAVTEQAQNEAALVRLRIADAEGQVAMLETRISQAQQARIQDSLRQFRSVLDVLTRQLPPQETLDNFSIDRTTLRESIRNVQNRLDLIDEAISTGTIERELENIQAMQRDLQLLGANLGLFIETSPERIVAPVVQEYINVRGSAYSAVVYYAPGVLALLIQHTAITLGALALVRERMMGAFEIFRVAPVNMVQLLCGKYLGYTLFIGLATSVMLLAMVLLGVPLLGSLFSFAILTLLLTLASLGIGFLISAVSSSDSQAIQLAMITLLLSIFFSGFFISLDSFLPAALSVSYSIPMTHGVTGYQYLMLRGLNPPGLHWLGLLLIAMISFSLVMIITHYQIRRA
ncbi:MAG: ABC transporter permease [Oscillochloris sp.]|nr:ABC transporter permease [Oscillochloris sp.]